MRYEHKKLGVAFELPDVEALVQRDVDRFMVAYNAQPPATDATRTVKAALLAGWVRDSDMSVDIVDTLAPRVVRWMAKQIDALYAAAIEIPGE